VQCSSVQCSAVQCRAVQCSAVQCSAAQVLARGSQETVAVGQASLALNGFHQVTIHHSTHSTVYSVRCTVHYGVY
jgi:hypothetical protein